MKVKNSISTTMRTLKGRETKDKAAKNIFRISRLWAIF